MRRLQFFASDSALRDVTLVEDGWLGKGMEQTPLDETGLYVARGEKQRATDPNMVAGLDAEPRISKEEIRELFERVKVVLAMLNRLRNKPK